MHTPPRYVIREEITQEIYSTFITGAQENTDNKAEIEKQALTYWDEEARAYEPKEPVSATYEGLVSISPSGAVASVAWEIGDDGLSRTSASYQLEDFSLPIPTRRESRFAEEARAMNARKRAARVDRDNAKRDRA
jgi:hypothetical protein